jgi:2-haloacid dehalogenase
MKPEAVVFDIGNVLVMWQPEAYYDARIGEAARRRMFAETDFHAVNLTIDEGAPFRETIYRLADRFPEWSGEIRLWHDDQFGMLQPVIERSVRMQRALRARGVPVFALSNWGDESFDRAAAHFTFMADFDRAFVSGKLGVKKPDPRIYAQVERDTGVAPGALLFVDDREENIRAAEARGWATHHFTGPQGLADRLVTEGLLTAEEAA